MSLKIIELRAENFKRLKAVEIRPDGDSLIVIRGKNGAGKSSVLDAIWAALGGKKAVPPRPIREGEERSEINLDLGDYVVTRVFTAKDTYLTVKNKDGAKIPNPQALLDTLIGDISFDPLEFARKKPIEQAADLARITGIDFEKLNQKRQEIFEVRAVVNREVKQLASTIAEMEKSVPDIANKKPVEQKSVIELMENYDSARAKYDKINGEIRELNDLEKSLRKKEDLLEHLKRQIAELDQEIHDGWKGLEVWSAKLQIESQNLPDPQVIQQQINSASEIAEANRVIRNYQRKKGELAEKQMFSDSLTRKLEIIEKEKVELIRKADLPVSNLLFDELCVLYNGIPFEQCSASEQLKVSTALAISLNPKLRVIRINNGSLLDSNTLSILESIAQKQDFQIWIERVDENIDGVGILIEDGQVNSSKTATSGALCSVKISKKV